MMQRRLIIRPGAIGDFIVSLPALLHLRAPYTEVWTTETNLPLAGFADARSSIVAAGLDRVGILDAEDVLDRLRTFDSIVSWYGANRPEFRGFVANAGLRFEFHGALPPAGASRHAVDYYCSQVGAELGAVPRIELGAIERFESVVVHPFASNEAKRWPAGVGFRVPGVKVVRLRGPEEQLDSARHIPDLLDLARFLAGARAYVGNDSGITHLAAAVGAPTVALFGPTDPAIWGPRGRTVRIIRAARMADIAEETVIDALRDFGIY
jgi:heptosyltransferase-3